MPRIVFCTVFVGGESPTLNSHFSTHQPFILAFFIHPLFTFAFSIHQLHLYKHERYPSQFPADYNLGSSSKSRLKLMESFGFHGVPVMNPDIDERAILPSSSTIRELCDPCEVVFVTLNTFTLSHHTPTHFPFSLYSWHWPSHTQKPMLWFQTQNLFPWTHFW